MSPSALHWWLVGGIPDRAPQNKEKLMRMTRARVARGQAREDAKEKRRAVRRGEKSKSEARRAADKVAGVSLATGLPWLFGLGPEYGVARPGLVKIGNGGGAVGGNADSGTISKVAASGGKDAAHGGPSGIGTNQGDAAAPKDETNEKVPPPAPRPGPADEPGHQPPAQAAAAAPIGNSNPDGGDYPPAPTRPPPPPPVEEVPAPAPAPEGILRLVSRRADGSDIVVDPALDPIVLW